MSVNREIQLGCALRSPSRTTRRVPRGGPASVGSRSCSTCRSLSTTRNGPPPSSRSTGPMPPPSGRMPISGSSSISTSAIIQLVDGIQTGELDAGGLADHAAPSVAADEILRSERRVIGQLDVDAGVVLREADHLTFAKDRNPELLHPAGQDALEVALPEREQVVVAGGEVADVQGDLGEAHASDEPGRPRRIVPRCHADRAPRWCGSGDRRLAIRRDPDWRVVRR